MNSRFRISAWILSLALVVASSSSCTKDYVTGKTTFNMIDEEEEVEIGREQDPVVVSQYGIYDDEALAVFVDDLGQSLAGVSHRPQLDYTFRVLDTPMINAFALPGGYIYVTRGILAHFSTVDQLAGVMGHEVGHVTARHSAKQMSRKIASTGFGLTTAIGKLMPRVGGLLEAPFDLALLKYGRDQELESDRLAVDYASKLGYDAGQLADFFALLDRMEAQSGSDTPGFLSTHPNPGDRDVKVRDLVAQTQSAPSFAARETDPDGYLRLIEGIVYGADPRQGFISGGIFYHPALRFQFPVPRGWKVGNTASSVTLVPEEPRAIMQLTLGDTDSPRREAALFVDEADVEIVQRSEASVGGLPAVIIEFVSGRGRDALRVLSYYIGKDSDVFVFHGIAGAADFPNFVDTFTRVMGGFSRVTDLAVLDVKPRRVRLVRAPRAGRIADVLADLGVAESDRLDISNLNGKAPDGNVERDAWIKIVE